MGERHGGRLLVECLVALGARKAFGVPGESYLAVLDALHDTGGALDFVLCRNEGGAGFMAAAWGKLTGQPGICMVTRGPGVTNASIGIHTAMQDSVPMLVFVGQVGTDMKGREAFQEVDYRAVYGTMAKWVTEIDRVERIPEIVSRAWTTAVSGRPGPVVVALPEDMLSSLTETPAIAGPVRIARPAPDAQAVVEARDLLAKAERPLIFFGGCNWAPEGRAALRRFAEENHVPAVAVFRYNDMMDNRSAAFAGHAGVGMWPSTRKLIEDADVILAVNVRFGENSTGGYSLLQVPDPVQKIIHVHASDLEIGKVYRPVLGVQADPSAFMQALCDTDGAGRAEDNWFRSAKAAFEKGFDLPAQPSPVDMGVVVRHLEGVLPEDAILTNGAGNFAVWPGYFFRFGEGQRLLAPQSGAMGYGLPAAVAAKVADPARTVVCFAGDGDFQMNCQELATARQAGATPIVLVLNNGIYGTIRAHQERHYPGRVSGTSMVSPDFATFARAYGMHGERVERTEDFAAAFDRALASETGAVLDLDISEEALTPRVTLSQMRAAAQKTGK
ncbi:thiamine pyrophosphate-dependent enzyme [Sagittula salina]|uniref:Thiamine pyrophosphate-binding protein n=1 Tax=Sagittula salina TaxID=2820268 RepID=A0A940MM28_9RHOB|nr:thiamine pyrophosphate-dependent enzyme [Sagittula salina]MBP0481201.1 thiamine pyrophosphate-binding protein [Sagittula salina]